MDINNSSATAELRGVGMFRRRRAPPPDGADIAQVLAFVDDFLAEEERDFKSEAARDPYAARLKAASLTACRGAWEFLKAVGQARARRDMLAVANSIAASRPELAARLRRAAREGWAE